MDRKSRLVGSAVEGCDPLGVVWHGHYFKYLELARIAMLTPLGLDGKELVALRAELTQLAASPARQSAARAAA